jgi:hypothetical protein
LWPACEFRRNWAGCEPLDIETGMCEKQTLYPFIFGTIGSFVSVVVLVVWFFRIFGLNEK